MRLEFERPAIKGLAAMPSRIAAVIVERLEAIATDPFAHHANVKPLKGEKNVFRLRQGDWRAIYRLDRKAGVMHVVVIGPRGSVYE